MTSESRERNPDIKLKSDPDLEGPAEAHQSETPIGSEGASADAALLGQPFPADAFSRQGAEFDPTPFIRQIPGRGGGTDYLDVKWRLLWLRKEHPDAQIVTEMVQHDPQMAIFKATVSVPTGGKATGYGSETASDFPDFIEKAETKAIGRALNALGYGAQFGDFQRPDESEIERAPSRFSSERSESLPRPIALPRHDENPRQRQEVRVDFQPATPPSTSSPATTDPELVEYSWSAFWPWARERGLNGPKEIENLIGQAVAGLSPAELRDFILAAAARR